MNTSTIDGIKNSSKGIEVVGFAPVIMKYMIVTIPITIEVITEIATNNR